MRVVVEAVDLELREIDLILVSSDKGEVAGALEKHNRTGKTGFAARYKGKPIETKGHKGHKTARTGYGKGKTNSKGKGKGRNKGKRK